MNYRALFKTLRMITFVILGLVAHIFISYFMAIVAPPDVESFSGALFIHALFLMPMLYFIIAGILSWVFGWIKDYYKSQC
jgi:ABC-type Fe3+ transport system permease subunit